MAKHKAKWLYKISNTNKEPIGPWRTLTNCLINTQLTSGISRSDLNYLRVLAISAGWVEGRKKVKQYHMWRIPA